MRLKNSFFPVLTEKHTLARTIGKYSEMSAVGTTAHTQQPCTDNRLENHGRKSSFQLLTKAHRIPISGLSLSHNQLTSVKGLESLTQLTSLDLKDNPTLTKAQIEELQKALPNCKITHNAKK